MYTFMTKFEELHKSLAPMKQLASQMYPFYAGVKYLVDRDN